MSNHPLAAFVRTFRAHAPLSDDDAEALLALPFHLRSVEAHAYLVREGEPPSSCGVLVTGFAYRQKTTGEGARQIVSLHIPGDLFDLQSLHLSCADHNVQALTRASVAQVSCPALRALVAERPRIAAAIGINNQIDASIAREWIVNVGRRDARTRLAHLLCEFGSRMVARGLASSDGFDLPMSQEQLGDALGLTSVHVNRTLRALDRDGYLVRRGRGIAFPNLDALREIGDFNALYLHLDEPIA